jgi:hypothetical protein
MRYEGTAPKCRSVALTPDVLGVQRLAVSCRPFDPKLRYPNNPQLGSPFERQPALPEWPA